MPQVSEAGILTPSDELRAAGMQVIRQHPEIEGVAGDRGYQVFPLAAQSAYFTVHADVQVN